MRGQDPDWATLDRCWLIVLAMALAAIAVILAISWMNAS